MKRILLSSLIVLSCLAASGNALAQEKAESVKRAEPGPTWAYQPIARPAVPAVRQKTWVRTPIDAFILERLEEKGIAPSAGADRATYIRRVTLDLWGVLPSPEEVKAFTTDRSPNAYEKLVDRLLASPRYGERQARRWLDLARYADSAGFTNDENMDNAWRYRDYVIAAFNSDKPYNQFVREQIAADELYPNQRDAWVATGFLRYYPDDSNSRDLVQRKYLSTTDMVDTLGTVFLGQSIECARCHNHKTDKVSQKDYYQLQAFFANANADDRIPVQRKGEIEAKYEREFAAWNQARAPAVAALEQFARPYLDAAEKYNKERFFEDTQVSLFKDKKEWDAHDRWINQRYENNLAITGNGLGRSTMVGGYLTYLIESAEDAAKKAEYEALREQYRKLIAAIREFDDLKPASGSVYISAITELGKNDAPPTHIRFTGIHDKLLDEVQPGVPELFNPAGLEIRVKPTATSSGRRGALADWVAHPQNPLTARVIVNRIWEQHFGRGIVGTVSDFGRAGERPSHPELLDHLASNFIQEGWSIKKLHRQIVLSSVYRQASTFREEAFNADSQNRLLAVFPRLRLESEQIRDSLLLASGQLVEKVGGPSVLPPIPAVLTTGGRNLWRTSDKPQDHDRRSLYIFTRRSVPYPLLEVFDGASSQITHARRDATTTPLQALTLVNNDLVYGWSQSLAGRAIKEGGQDDAARLTRLYQILYSRDPDEFEKKLALSFLDEHEKVLQARQDVDSPPVLPKGVDTARTADAPLRLAAFVDLAHTLANANEFVYRY
jgi:hypothetical protein